MYFQNDGSAIDCQQECRKILAPDARGKSIVMIWLAPEAFNQLAKSLALMGARGFFFLSCRA